MKPTAEPAMTASTAPTREIEIFRAGTHTPSSGDPITFAASDLAATAGGYDPGKSEAPVVVGHPATDGPAYAWVSGLQMEGDRLVARLDQIDPQFAEMVRAGRFKHVSAAFYPPAHARNPVPGTYYLRHVGFLGAMPPAVAGLKPAQFADASGVVTFSADAPAFADWCDLSVARMFRALREFVARKFGQAEADQTLPAEMIDQLQEMAAADEGDGGGVCCSDPDPETEVTVPPNADDLAAREAAIARREAELADRRKKQVTSENAAFMDAHADRIGGGDARARMVAFMDRLDADVAVSFADGSGKVERTMLEQFKELVKGLPKVVEFGEIAGATGDGHSAIEFAAPAGFAVDAAGADLHSKALAYQRTHPDAPYIDAVKAVGGR